MAAMNFQTNGLPMQMNQSMFVESAACGYLLKPKCLRDGQSRMSVYDSHILVANRLEVISAQMICLLSTQSMDSQPQWSCSVAVDLYVECVLRSVVSSHCRSYFMYDLPLDTVRNKYRTDVVNGDGYNAFFPKRNRKFVFEKARPPQSTLSSTSINYLSR